jgi:hypothetical protein
MSSRKLNFPTNFYGCGDGNSGKLLKMNILPWEEEKFLSGKGKYNKNRLQEGGRFAKFVWRSLGDKHFDVPKLSLEKKIIFKLRSEKAFVFPRKLFPHVRIQYFHICIIINQPWGGLDCILTFMFLRFWVSCNCLFTVRRLPEAVTTEPDCVVTW